MTNQLPEQSSAALPSALEDLVPRPMLFADEDARTYEDLHDALVSDLAPAAPYERVLAEHLVVIEWEIVRHRRLRDNLIKAMARDLAIGVFATGKIQHVSQCEDAHRNLAIALVSGEREGKAEALAALFRLKITPAELFAEAHSEAALRIVPHERKLAELENRRRRLREDYDRLKAVRRKPVEDAEVVE